MTTREKGPSQPPVSSAATPVVRKHESRPSGWFDMFRFAALDFLEDGAMGLAAALSYYTLLSLSPLLILAVVVAGTIAGREATREELLVRVQDLMGDAGADVTRTILISADRPAQGLVALAIGFVVLVFGATSVFVQLQDALNRVWEVEPRARGSLLRFARARMLSIIMVLATGTALAASLAASTILGLMRGFFRDHVGEIGWAWSLADVAASAVMMSLLFAVMFKVLPDIRVPWRHVMVGALVTGGLMTLGKFALGWYLAHSSVGSPYGAAGSVVVLLVWVYYSWLIVFFGAELTQAYARLRGVELGNVC